MRIPAWPRRLLARRPRRPDAVRQRLMEPVRLSIRRLEQRRVLDASATFTAAGELSLHLSGAAEAATISARDGNIVVTDAQQQTVEIHDESGSARSVGISEVKSLSVAGDDAPDQAVHLNVPLAPVNGVLIESSIETAVITRNITRVADGNVSLNAEQTHLGADIEARDNIIIEIGGDVVLTNNVTLAATEVFFEGGIDDDGDGKTPSALTVNASATTRFGGEVGGTSPIDRLLTDAAGQTEINADISATGGTLIFNDPVVLTSSVSLSDTGPTGIKFNSTVDSLADGKFDLELSATAGRVTFSGDVGAGGPGDQQRLGSLTVTSAGGGVVFGEKFGISEVRTTGRNARGRARRTGLGCGRRQAQLHARL